MHLLRGGVRDVAAVRVEILTQRSSTCFKLFLALALLAQRSSTRFKLFLALALLAFHEIQLIMHLSELLSKHCCIWLQFRAYGLGPHANCEGILGLLECPPLWSLWVSLLHSHRMYI